MNKNSEWTEIIKPKHSWFDLRFRELYDYKDLIYILARKDIVMVYKQTVLGFVWFLIPPIINSLTFYFIFGYVAPISTDKTPPFIFYLCNTIAWGYFADCLTKTANTFQVNSSIFGKVYFPRLIPPISVAISSLAKFGVQLAMFLCFYVFFSIISPDVTITYYIFWVPFLILLMALLGLGFGIIVSSLTTKYRDLSFMINIGVQLLMYASPVIYPLSSAPEKWRWVLQLNPMTTIIEIFRIGFLGQGSFSLHALIYTVCVVFGVLITGVIIYNRVEKTFMDTV